MWYWILAGLPAEIHHSISGTGFPQRSRMIKQALADRKVAL